MQIAVGAQAAAPPANGLEPGNGSALPLPGSFRFNAGKVGSAGMTKKRKKRQGDLSALQKELSQQRAAFLQWHQQELAKAKAGAPCTHSFHGNVHSDMQRR